MTTKYLLVALLGACLFLGSCKKEEEVVTQEQTTTSEPAAAGPKITTTPVKAAPTGEKPALNPAHGEPFHRCDIAVGAPLDGPATQKGDSPIKNSPGPKSFFKTVQSENATTAATPTPQATPQAQTQATTTITPNAKPAAPAATTANTPKPKNNPAHGQPHHRCDIAVGAPLPDA